MTSDRATLMFPLMVDLTIVPVFVIGDGEAAVSRLAMLDEHGAQEVFVFAPVPSPELISAAAERLIRHWPDAADFADVKPRLVFVAGPDDAIAADIHARGQAVGAFVHVQDRIPLCDFHLPARLRRGRLLVTVSTDGAAAGLSRLIRDYLAANVFGVEWAARVEELAAARKGWKSDGLSMAALFDAISRFVAERRWLPGTAKPAREV